LKVLLKCGASRILPKEKRNLTSKPNKIEWRQPRKLQAILPRLSLISGEEYFQGEASQRKEKSDAQNNPIIFFYFISPQKARPAMVNTSYTFGICQCVRIGL